MALQRLPCPLRLAPGYGGLFFGSLRSNTCKVQGVQYLLLMLAAMPRLSYAAQAS